MFAPGTADAHVTLNALITFFAKGRDWIHVHRGQKQHHAVSPHVNKAYRAK
jgi:hypothetical protein